MLFVASESELEPYRQAAFQAFATAVLPNMGRVSFKGVLDKFGLTVDEPRDEHRDLEKAVMNTKKVADAFKRQ